ncbi:hypothetical protein BU16DRAFT_613281 [Lophium mytilinum]|uniref:Uncharacterized protein n=1 Tax=Lophium mytilinum TaxID=390894 RepID=A0A6A6RA16_9PEZI|nr:hypothetical protein BU16DRAFT_613281 [Lophium mytilinum]
MDSTSTAGTWLPFTIVTVFGIGSLIYSMRPATNVADPFQCNSNAKRLGSWAQWQKPQTSWRRVANSPLQGPTIDATLSGFCGVNTLHLSRLPLTDHGAAGWTVLLSVCHSQPPDLRDPNTSDPTSKTCSNECEKSWQKMLIPSALTPHRGFACITISRATLITLFCLTNARPAFQYSGPAGFRAAYASYCGQWYVTWPIGEAAFVHLVPHDSHSTATDVYPSTFVQRVDRCVEMVVGVITGREIQLAFCGRKPPGVWFLEYVPKGFPAAHGSRHLYNMMGGKVYEVDFMAARKRDISDPDGMLELQLPSTEEGRHVTMYVPETEEAFIKHALDCLPWASLSWSIHRGMRDILVAYAKPVMDTHRKEFAAMLKATVSDKPQLLNAKGWSLSFVCDSMGDMAADAVLAGRGNSGDLVRVVTDIVKVIATDLAVDPLDENYFWRSVDRQFDIQGLLALTKLFVLEWSVDFDYQMYHHLPTSLYFG